MLVFLVYEYLFWAFMIINQMYFQQKQKEENWRVFEQSKVSVRDCWNHLYVGSETSAFCLLRVRGKLKYFRRSSSFKLILFYGYFDLGKHSEIFYSV